MNFSSKFTQGCYKLTDLIFLNVICILCCIPVITAGAAVTSLYSVTLKMVRDEEGSILKDYFRAFRSNFKQATVLWLIAAAAIIFLFIDFRIALTVFSDIPQSLYLGLMAAIVIVLMCMLSFLFPLTAWFENKNIQMIKNSLLISCVNPGYTVLILVLNASPFLVFFIPGDFIKWVFALYFFIWFSGIAYLNSKMLRNLFDKIGNG